MPIIDDAGGDINLSVDPHDSGEGRIIFSVGGVEYASIENNGTATGLLANGGVTITSNDGSITITKVSSNVDLSVTSAVATTAPVMFSHVGPAVTGTGVSRVPLPAAATIGGVIATANTAPTGQSLIFDVNKNGTTIFTTQANRPAIAAGTNSTSLAAIPDVTALATGDYLTVDIDQVGSSVAGADLVVVVYFS